MSEHAIARHQVRRPPTVRDLIAPPIAAVLVVMLTGLGIAAVSPTDARGPVLFCASVAAIVVGLASVFAVRNRQIAMELRGRVVTLEAKVKTSTAQTERLSREVLPLVVTRLREGATAQAALGEAPRGTDGAHLHILRTVAEEVSRGERMRSAAMAACASAAGRMQALSTAMLADLRTMEERHSEEVLGDLLRLDHLTAQAGRLADSIAVLTGGRSGRRWTKPIVMESLLRGAMGRISAYQRVRLHSTSTVAVVGYAAEGVMHTLAELMDNATSFSPPSEEVHVYVEEVQAGVVITIEDGGLVMGQAALERAERAVSAESLDLTSLSGTRLGLAVVGVLARKHGLTVSFRPSSRGGTGAIVMVPRQLITAPRSVEPPPTISDATDAATTGLRTAVAARAPRALPPAAADDRHSRSAAASDPGFNRQRQGAGGGGDLANHQPRRPDPSEFVTALGALPTREPGAFPTRAGTRNAPSTEQTHAHPHVALDTGPSGTADTAAATGIDAVTARITLPKRARGQSLTASTRAAGPAVSRPRSHRARRNSIANFAAFRRAMRAASATRSTTTRPAAPGPTPASPQMPTQGTAELAMPGLGMPGPGMPGPAALFGPTTGTASATNPAPIDAETTISAEQFEMAALAELIEMAELAAARTSDEAPAMPTDTPEPGPELATTVQPESFAAAVGPTDTADTAAADVADVDAAAATAQASETATTSATTRGSATGELPAAATDSSESAVTDIEDSRPPATPGPTTGPSPAGGAGAGASAGAGSKPPLAPTRVGSAPTRRTRPTRTSR
ncbi:Signal transduction histidine kinase [Parafrankia irregularis]|uniref:histidine kinase n=1 Tax=Parafrankia irregularis TaxID=795642 RepID=A0A0S4QWR9_9ACTN|nr:MULTISPECIES: ATP-binding protein [Parafrankia]MBE3202403.1 sensor histidine kinase [Parafrankia sp. CH37]CUU58918.1 Signal transduction histidine kinase [Parafrankia irregularis]